MSNKTFGQLWVVATPLGNLGDLSDRAKQVLAEVDLILCEDTRVTVKMLSALGLRKPLTSVHEYTESRKLDQLVTELEQGKVFALVTDAGTPAISDPGSVLVARAASAGVRVSPVPGPSAVTTALSISGFNFDRFTFVGFPPHKKGRNKFFEALANLDHVIVMYESTHRILKTLEALQTLKRPLVVCRELTKLHETTYRGTAEEVKTQLESSSTKGEFVIVIGNHV